MMEKGACVEEINALDRLKQREHGRLLEQERKRHERKENSAAPQIADFLENFCSKKCEIEQDFNALSSLEKSEVLARFDKLTKDLQVIQKYLADSTLFLPAYEIRKAQGIIQELQQTYQELEDELIPKKKFGFKGRKAKKERVQHDAPDGARAGSLFGVHFAYKEDGCGFTSKEGETLQLLQDQLNKEDVMLSKLTNCVVKLYGSPSTIHMTGLVNCKIMSGPVATSVFVEDCEDCVFLIPCQQLRIHHNKSCDFYLHVTSRAIIEDTSQVRVAPFNWKYGDMDDHFESAGLNKGKNNWKLVDDFNWLAADKPSPNWSVIPESERITEWE